MSSFQKVIVSFIALIFIAFGSQNKPAEPLSAGAQPVKGQLGQACLANETCNAPWRCYAGECRHPCLVSRDCEHDGKCAPHPKLFWSSKKQSWAIKPFTGMEFKVGFDVSESGLLREKLCRPTESAHCALSKACTDRGQCGLGTDPTKSPDRAQPMCRATEVAHCEKSKGCKRSGKCTLAPDEPFTGCIKGPMDDAFCKKTRACKKRGACSAGPEGQCIVKSDADCQSGGSCKNEGKCQAKDGQCIVASNAHCAGSLVCKMAGGCAAVNGACAPAEAAHCAGSRQCKMEGKCGLLNGACAPVEPEHCRGPLCQMLGLCTVNAGGYCEADAAQCAKHRLCTDQGLCSVKTDDKMVVRKGRRKMTQNFKKPRLVCATAEGFDCSSIKACAEHGACTYDAQRNRCRARDA